MWFLCVEWRLRRSEESVKYLTIKLQIGLGWWISLPSMLIIFSNHNPKRKRATAFFPSLTLRVMISTRVGLSLTNLTKKKKKIPIFSKPDSP